VKDAALCPIFIEQRWQRELQGNDGL